MKSPITIVLSALMMLGFVACKDDPEPTVQGKWKVAQMIRVIDDYQDGASQKDTVDFTLPPYNAQTHVIEIGDTTAVYRVEGTNEPIAPQTFKYTLTANRGYVYTEEMPAELRILALSRNGLELAFAYAGKEEGRSYHLWLKRM